MIWGQATSPYLEARNTFKILMSKIQNKSHPELWIFFFMDTSGMSPLSKNQPSLFPGLRALSFAWLFL